MKEGDATRFAELFVGNARSFGQFYPGRQVEPMLTVKAPRTEEHFRSHLQGEVGIGIVPIMDDNTCHFAVIDVDVHGPNGVKVDMLQIEQKATRAKLPLTICRSKSGGAHCYLFLKNPTEASRVRMMMGRWAGVIGHPQAEVFPKQTNLDKVTGKDRPLGNWINLPYFDEHETERYAIEGAKPILLDRFLELAETRRANLEDYDKEIYDEYANGPPCLEQMLVEKIDEGARNVGVFQAGIYLKRSFPDDWRQKLEDFNRKALVTGLDSRELRTIASSVGRKDYQYKCREEPCKSLCNRDLCKTRQFGITAGDQVANEIPIVEAVEKVIATPIRWVLTVRGLKVEVTTAELFKYEMVRQRVGEKLHIVMPRIKDQEWDQYLKEIMEKVTVREETTLEDVIFMRLCEFLRRVPTDKSRLEEDRRVDLKRGLPTLIAISRMTFTEGKSAETGKVWYYAFKMADFIDHLRRKKALTIPDHQMGTILYRLLGPDAKRDKIRVGGTYVGNVWCVPEESIQQETVPVKQFESEY